MTPQQFYSQYLPYAETVSNRTGLDPRLVLAQAALETGYGKSAPGMNFFGIKSHGRDGGQTLQTSEFEGGQMVRQPASFRAYESPEQSFQDYADFLQSNPRYEGVLSARGLEGQIAEMAKSGYATDPQYGAKLANIASQFDPSAPSIIAADAMRAIGRQPRGVLAPQAIEQTETENMIPQDKPRGLLGSLGIQKMEEGAEGETGQRFYQRDTFKDTAATLAQGFAAMGSNPGLQKFAADVAAQRSEGRARNKTVEYLRANGRGDLADMVEKGLIGGKEAASVLLRQPKATGQVVSAEQLRQMFPGSEIAEGLYNLKPDGTVNKVGGGPQVVVEGQKGVDEFAKLDARTLADVSNAGMAAGRSLAQIDRLGALLEGVPTGASGALKVAAGNFGIQTEGLDDLQAAQALINTLVPQQRPPGSGPMSDADLELFKQSLPRIINSPNGNKIILDTMRGVAQYDAMGAEIVQRYRAGDITQAEAFSQLQSRPDPFAGLNLGAAQAQPGGGMSREDALTVLGG
jgi:flagellar protein FlgJ